MMDRETIKQRLKEAEEGKTVPLDEFMQRMYAEHPGLEKEVHKARGEFRKGLENGTIKIEIERIEVE